MARIYNILVVEKSDFLREKIAGYLSRGNGGATMVSQISDPGNLSSAMSGLIPDVLLMDISAAISQQETLRSIRDELSGIRIIIYSDEMGEEYRHEAQRLGAHGFVDVNRLSEGIRDYLGRHIISSN